MKPGDQVYLTEPPPGLNWGAGDGTVVPDEPFVIVKINVDIDEQDEDDAIDVYIRRADGTGPSSWVTGTAQIRPATDTDDPNMEW